jgi:hypothetical protein
MLENYKDQGGSVERGFRFLKDPLFFPHCVITLSLKIDSFSRHARRSRPR